METWGETTQRSLEKKHKHWYTHYWKAGNEWTNDYVEEHRLNVVLATTQIEEVVNYLLAHKSKCPIIFGFLEWIYSQKDE